MFYANDFLGSTAEMDNATVGAYIKLLCYQWINGDIPIQKDKIAKLLQVDNTVMAVLWEDLSKKFITNSQNPDRLQNKRLEKIRNEALEYRKNRAMAGKKGMEKRWKDHKETDNTVNNSVITQFITNGITKHNSSSSSSSSNIDTIKKEKENIYISKIFQKPSIPEIQEFCNARNNSVDPERFWHFYESKNWMIGKSKMKSWKSAIITWEKSGFSRANKKTEDKSLSIIKDFADMAHEVQI